MLAVERTGDTCLLHKGGKNRKVWIVSCNFQNSWDLLVAGIQNLVNRVNDPVVGAEVCTGNDCVIYGDGAIESPEKALDADIDSVAGQECIGGSRLKISKRNALRNDVVGQDACEGLPVGKQGRKIIF